MKKFITLIMVLATVLCCVSCSSDRSEDAPKIDTFTIKDLESALLDNDIELGEFEVVEQDDGYSFTANIGTDLIVSGTADKNEMVTTVVFKNFSLSTNMFSSKTSFEEWYSQINNNMDMTLNQLDAASKVLRCIDELEAFYSLTGKGSSEDSFLFAINTLITKKSSEIKDWDIKVTESSPLFISATYTKD